MSKIKAKNPKKLTRKDFEQMWGEEGPYSQVRLCEETRILDDAVSRVFLVVEAEINPFTFEFVAKHYKQFLEDEPVLQLLDHAEYRGQFGYVVSAGETELDGKESWQFAREQADMTIETLIRMHEFVMRECGLEKRMKKQNAKKSPVKKTSRIREISSMSDFAEMSDSESNTRFVWNKMTGRIEPADAGAWDEKTFVGSAAGIKNDKIRMFFVCAYEKDFLLKKGYGKQVAKTLFIVGGRFRVDVEDCEPFMEYLLVTALVPFDVAPADFITTFLRACVTENNKPFFKKDYLVTNDKKPTPKQIMSFLGQLPLDRDIAM